MIYTTLNRIRAHGPCLEGWRKLLRHLGKITTDDEPLALSVVLESNGIEDALWCLRAEPQHASIWRLLAVRYARRVQHLMRDPRRLDALDVAERHALGQASHEELAAARDAAAAAARDAAWDAARDAARVAAAAAARDAAWDAAWVAAWVAAAAAARDAAWDAARDAAWVAAAAAARDAAWAAMAADLMEALTSHHATPGEP